MAPSKITRSNSNLPVAATDLAQRSTVGLGVYLGGRSAPFPAGSRGAKTSLSYVLGPARGLAFPSFLTSVLGQREAQPAEGPWSSKIIVWV